MSMRRGDLSRFAAFSFIGSVTLMPLLALPAMIGVLVDNAAMSQASAAWSASLNFLASAVVGLALATRVHHINLRKVATIALTLAIFADIASAYTAGDTATFFAARLVAGLMLGAAYVATVSSFPRFDGYERGFGLFVTFQFIISGVSLYVIPVYADALGAKGLFWIFAAMDGLSLLFVQFLPSEVAVSVENKRVGSELKILITAVAVLAIVGFAMFEAAANAQFTYIERFGVALHVSDQRIGFSLLIASLVGIPGAFAIVIFGQRFGTRVPLLLGIGIAVSGQIILIYSESYAAYFLGSCLMGFSWAFCLPFIQSLLASIDRNGSAIAAGTSFSTFGSSFGPGLAALVIGGGNYVNVFLLSIGMFVIAAALFFYADTHKGQIASD